MSNIVKRYIAAFLIVCNVFLLSACGDDSADSSVKIQDDDKLTIWAWDDNYNICALQLASEDYKVNHPDSDIEIVSMSQEETVAKLNSALMTNSTESLPDIVLVEDYRIQKYLQNYLSYFADLSSIASVEDFANYKTGMNQVDGKLYGIPFDSGVVGLFYRLDYIEEAGYSEDDMHNLTWDKYIEIGKKVKEKTGKYMLTLNPTDLPMIRMILQSEGSWYTDDSGNLNLADNPAMEAAIKVYIDIVNAGIAQPVGDWNQFIGSFQKGDTASVVSGSWVSSSILETSEQSGLWRVAELPSLTKSDKVCASSVGGSGWYVLNNDKTELAKEFLQETFVSDLSLVNVLAEKINLVSALVGASECDNYHEGVEFYGGQKIFENFYLWTSEIPAVNYGDSTYDIEQCVAEAIQNVLSGETIQQALKECEKSYLSN